MFEFVFTTTNQTSLADPSFAPVESPTNKDSCNVFKSIRK